MNDSKVRKLQYLVTRHLLKFGKLEIMLPDGFKVEIGTLQEDQYGNLVKTDDYCYVVASRGCNSTSIDSYSLALQYDSDEDLVVCEDVCMDQNGNVLKCLDVV